MEENKVASDSSAPNSPEVTRLSGEQAEERTAREIRMDREAIRKLAQRVVDAHDANDGMRLSQAIDDLDAAFPPDDLLALLSECSRLASRVEELEKGLRKTIAYLKQEDFAASYSYLSPALEAAENALKENDEK